jgi:hypothetical protein
VDFFEKKFIHNHQFTVFMRKIFTILFILSLSYRWVDLQAQILWGGPNDPNSTFAGGFNGWTTQGLSSADPTKADSARWYWSAAASAAGGAYYGTRGAINSASKANGAMVFNSDLYDNAGIAGNFGNGKCPSPHSGVLISPVINCTTFNSVALKFTQYYRNFQSTCFVDVSNDGGANWVSFQLNTDVATNAETVTNSSQLINISAIAANQANVQIRFRFDGEYYFWIIDDVQLVKVPDYDLALTSHFYTPQSYRQPKSQICQDTFIFQANVSNKGGIQQTNCILRGEILDIDRKTVLFKDSANIGDLATTVVDSPFRTTNFYVPNLNYGKYYFRYTIYSKDATGADFNTKDNTRLDSFEVSLNNYAKAPRSTGGVRAGNGAAYTFGNQYRTSDCWNANDIWVATEAKFQLVANPGGTLAGYGVSVYLLKVHDDILGDFSNFDDAGGITSTSIDIRSAETFTGTTEANNDDIIVPLTDFDTPGGKVILTKGSRYFLGVDHPATPSGAVPVFHVISNEKSYNAQIFSTFVIDDSGAWFNGFQGTNTPILELNIDLMTKTDNKPLPSTVMSIYPNPVVTNFLKVGLSFDQATDANLTLADVNGRVLGFESHKAVTKDVFSINTSDLKAGNYLIRVSTDEGTSTKQFTVVK